MCCLTEATRVDFPHHTLYAYFMSTVQYKKTLTIRFFAYLSVFVGALAILFQFGPVLNSELGYQKDQLFGVRHTLAPEVVNSAGIIQHSNPGSDNTGFGSVGSLGSTQITPVSTDFGIVIPKINANSKVIPDIDPANSEQYTQALAVGVAEAQGSTPPGQNGNLYIFSHSVDAPWNIARFNAVFYLLRNVESGDEVDIFYQGRRYQYTVFDKQIVDPSEVSLLEARYDKPVLTLQTCDPPGFLTHRLIVRAKLVGS